MRAVIRKMVSAATAGSAKPLTPARTRGMLMVILESSSVGPGPLLYCPAPPSGDSKSLKTAFAGVAPTVPPYPARAEALADSGDARGAAHGTLKLTREQTHRSAHA